eukprot:4998766-Alexandrium_andersonii.AAC.1
MDIGAFEALSPFPVRVLLWRPSSAASPTHRIRPRPRSYSLVSPTGHAACTPAWRRERVRAEPPLA